MAPVRHDRHGHDRADVSTDDGELGQIINPLGEDFMRSENEGTIDPLLGIRQRFEGQQDFPRLIARVCSAVLTSERDSVICARPRYSLAFVSFAAAIVDALFAWPK